MDNVARSTDKITAINFPFKYSSSLATLQRLIDQDKLGEIEEIIIKIRFPRWPRSWQDVSWLEDHDQGGPLREVGSHFIYAVQGLFGDIIVQSNSFRLTSPGRFKREIQVTFQVSYSRKT